MHRFLLALCAALFLMVAAVAPTFAQESVTLPGAEPIASNAPVLLMRALQSDPQTSRTMVFVAYEDDRPMEKLAAEAEEGATESTICGKSICVCKADAHGGCDLFKWLCGKLGGQHIQGGISEGCAFPTR